MDQELNIIYCWIIFFQIQKTFLKYFLFYVKYKNIFEKVLNYEIMGYPLPVFIIYNCCELS